MVININIEELINELAKNTGKSLLQKEEDNNEIINLLLFQKIVKYK